MDNVTLIAHLRQTIFELKEENEQKQAEIDSLEDLLYEIKQWCRAYPRTVFIEPTKEQWAEANKVLEANRPECASLTAISGSNMRHVVEGIQKIIDQAETDKDSVRVGPNATGANACIGSETDNELTASITGRLPGGFIVKIGGLPFTLAYPTLVDAPESSFCLAGIEKWTKEDFVTEKD